MEVERFVDVDAFLARVGPFLEAREAEHCLLLGIGSTLAGDPTRVAGRDYLAGVLAGGRIVAVAVQAPPFGLVLSEVDRPAALDVLADDLATVDLPSVLGPAEHAGTLARDLAQRRGYVAVLESSQRLFRSSSVGAPRPTTGRLRAATMADRELLIDWFAAFEQEALGETEPEGIEEIVDERLDRGWIHLWDDDGPVSFVGIGGLTPHGVLLEGGYTPPALRGRGYSANVVSALSRSLLAGGRRSVFLFTDRANPTSNHIYPGLGFDPVRDVEVWRLESR